MQAIHFLLRKYLKPLRCLLLHYAPICPQVFKMDSFFHIFQRTFIYISHQSHTSYDQNTKALEYHPENLILKLLILYLLALDANAIFFKSPPTTWTMLIFSPLCNFNHGNYYEAREEQIYIITKHNCRYQNYFSVYKKR